MVKGTRPTLVLYAEANTGIRQHGQETYPHECCGALIGRGEHVTEAVALPNTTDEGPRRRFLVSPADYRLAEGRAAGSDRELLGFYHSHPDHQAQPSQHDLARAWPFFAYVILSVRQGESAELTAWRLRDDRSAFDAVPVAMTPEPGVP